VVDRLTKRPTAYRRGLQPIDGLMDDSVVHDLSKISVSSCGVYLNTTLYTRNAKTQGRRVGSGELGWLVVVVNGGGGVGLRQIKTWGRRLFQCHSVTGESRP
jgi:hypothetical protein